MITSRLRVTKEVGHTCIELIIKNVHFEYSENENIHLNP